MLLSTSKWHKLRAVGERVYLCRSQLRIRQCWYDSESKWALFELAIIPARPGPAQPSPARKYLLLFLALLCYSSNVVGCTGRRWKS